MKQTYPHEWLAKAVWNSTAFKFKIEARNEKQAWQRAWGIVSKMEGGDTCLEVKLVSQLR